MYTDLQPNKKQNTTQYVCYYRKKCTSSIFTFISYFVTRYKDYLHEQCLVWTLYLIILKYACINQKQNSWKCFTQWFVKYLIWCKSSKVIQQIDKDAIVHFTLQYADHWHSRLYNANSFHAICKKCKQRKKTLKFTKLCQSTICQSATRY